MWKMKANIKVTLIFDPSCKVGQSDLDWLSDRIIGLLKTGFPEHSGTFMSLSLVDDSGDPIKK
jgi:hypothetical protein